MFNKQVFFTHLREQTTTATNDAESKAKKAEEEARQERIAAAQEKLKKKQAERNKKDFGTETPSQEQIAGRSARKQAQRDAQTQRVSAIMGDSSGAAMQQAQAEIAAQNELRKRMGQPPLNLKTQQRIQRQAARRQARSERTAAAQAAAAPAGAAVANVTTPDTKTNTTTQTTPGTTTQPQVSTAADRPPTFRPQNATDVATTLMRGAGALARGDMEGAADAGDSMTSFYRRPGADMGSRAFDAVSGVLGYGALGGMFGGNLSAADTSRLQNYQQIQPNQIRTPTGAVVNPQAAPTDISNKTLPSGQTTTSSGMAAALPAGPATPGLAPPPTASTQDERLVLMQKLMAQGMSQPQAMAELARRGMVRAPKT